MAIDRNFAFRTAAVLFADSSNNAAALSKTKIIESVFLENNNSPLSLYDISNKINKNLGLYFEEKELKKLIESSKKNHFYCRLKNGSSNEMIVSLYPDFYHQLINKEKTNNIENFIEQFYENFNHKISLDQESVKKLLFKYFYELLSTNYQAFSKMINTKSKVNGDIFIETEKFSESERQIINDFLSWDNLEKDKSIFNVVSSAIEFCLINNNTEGGRMIKGIRNKEFYIDNNVIYRLLGINGVERKEKIEIFLHKCIENGIKFRISLFTLQEFNATIEGHINQLKKLNYRMVSPKIFKQVGFNPNIYEFYHTWRSNRRSTMQDFDVFEASIRASLDESLEKFDIEKKYTIPFNYDEEKVQKSINEIAQDLDRFKNKGFQIALFDAKNTYLIEQLRKSNATDFSDTKYFFISVDQKLRTWDFRRNDKQPIAILPSQWLSFMLRFVPRSNDDFGSFVSFLKMSRKEPILKEDNLNILISEISLLTEDFAKQEKIIEKLIEKKFTDIFRDGNDIDTIKQNIQKESKSILDNLFHEEKIKLEQEKDEMTQTHEKIYSTMNSRFQTLEKSNEELKKMLDLQRNLTEWEKNKINYIKKEIKTKKKEISISILYSMKVVGLKILVLLIGPVIYKNFNSIRDILQGLGISEGCLNFIIPTVFGLIAVYELAFRTYFVDKDKVKNGLKYFIIKMSKKSMADLEVELENELAQSYALNNPSPNLIEKK